MKQTFDRFPDMDYLLIVEDDILFSNDTLEFFERCKQIMHEHPELAVATTYNLFRLYVNYCMCSLWRRLCRIVVYFAVFHVLF